MFTTQNQKKIKALVTQFRKDVKNSHNNLDQKVKRILAKHYKGLEEQARNEENPDVFLAQSLNKHT